MFRKALGFLVLVAAVLGVWYAARLVRHETPLEATILFESRDGLEAGAPVVLDRTRIGTVRQVTALGGKTAALIRVGTGYRNQVLTDSLFEVTGTPPQVRVVNSIAVGPPLTDGAVVVARRDKLTNLLVKGHDTISPTIEKAKEATEQWIRDFDSGRFDEQLREWKKEVPRWKAEGREAFDENVEMVNKNVDEVERELRRLSRDVEADELRKKFDAWVKEVGRD